VREVAVGLGLPVWQPRVDARGVVELPELQQGSRTSLDTPHPDDDALVAYTSGTMGRDLASRARSIARGRATHMRVNAAGDILYGVAIRDALFHASLLGNARERLTR
jgi:hypothetical protein